MTICFITTVSAQKNLFLKSDTITVSDTAGITHSPGIVNGIDTLIHDSISIDTTVPDTVVIIPKRRKSALEDKVQYSAKDSMRISITGKKLYLFGEAHVTYTDIELNAEYIELDLGKEEVFARGVYDTIGKVTGKPVFKKGDESFESDSLKYNFSTEKGVIFHIITQQGEGYLHSDKTKRHENGHIHIKDGKYTTCDAEHPHFYLSLNKGIVIPEDKIVTGYAYMVLEDVPINILFVPFGFFPNTTKRSSGILFPSYGEENRRGFFLRDGGWYQVLGDHADLTIRGDVYTRGSWAIRNTLSYKFRYKYSGNFGFDYAMNKDKDDPTYVPTKDYKLMWSHRQDPKANPTQNFSANVNYRSVEYDRLHSYNTESYLSNNTSSSISFSKRWPGTPFNLSLSANATQNSQSRQTNFNLPTGSFNMSSIYPFRNESGSGKYKWYENISLTYSSKFDNQIEDSTEWFFSDIDSLRHQAWAFENMENGFQHSIPLAVNFKLGKLVTITPSLSYTGKLYSAYTVMDSVIYDTAENDVVEYSHEVQEFKYAQAVNPSISVSFTPKMYGMYQSTRQDGYVEAVRHVISPSVSISFTPDMRKINRNYYDTLRYLDENDSLVYHRVFNIFEDQLYRDPPSSNGKSGSLRLALNNNLEMKVHPKNDTTGEAKKVSILDNLNFSTSYNPFKEEFKWSDVTMVAGTKILNNKLNLRINGKFTMYASDSLGRDIDEFYYKNMGGGLHFLRLRSISFTTGYSIRSKSGKDEEEGEEETSEDEVGERYLTESDLEFMPGYLTSGYVDFSIPWSFNFDYHWSYSKRNLRTVRTHTVDISGDFSLTQKWKIGMSGGYDIENDVVVFPRFSIHRDLHCWEMTFTSIPLGPRKSYTFTIRAKASLLRDLKYEKKPNWYDQF